MTETRGGAPDRVASIGRVRKDTYYQVKVQLGRLIDQLAENNQLRLPAEDELAAHLEVSRATVRSALLSLQKDGRIQRVHGRGTFINRHAAKISANISQDRPFAGLLDEMGYTVDVRIRDVHVEKIEAELLEPLELKDMEDACVIERIFDASGEPAVVSHDFIPVSHLLETTEGFEGQDSVFEFVRRYTGRRIRYSVADIVPIIPSTEIATALRTSPNHPLILLRHTHIDEDDEPVAYTRAYVNDRLLRFSVVRTYTDS